MRKNTTIIKIFGAVVVLVLTSLTSIGGISNGTNTLIEINNIDETTIEIVVNSLDFSFASIITGEGDFATIELESEGFTTNIGEARLPTITRMIEIPQGANPEIVVTSVSWELTSLEGLDLPSRVIPVQPSVVKIPGASEAFVIDDGYYTSDEFMPEDIAKVVDIGEIRGHRFALVDIYPVKYSPSSGELKTMASCKIIVNLPGSNMVQTYDKMERYFSPSFDAQFDVAFANYGYYGERVTINSRNQEGYLIIVYDDFEDEVMPLVNWKISKGYDVTMTKTSDIPGGPTKDNIYNYIEDAYDTWNIPPSYVLLAGDVPDIPTFTGLDSYSATDLYFVTVDGSDYFADIYRGRFPASDEADITVMVDKTIYYEQGSFPSYDWINKGAFIASSDMGQFAEQTHNFVIDNYLTPNGYTCDKIYEASGGNTADIFNSLNDGRSLCVYSGHGYSGGWGCVPFDQSDVSSLTNDGMYPFVCSHACSTNPFDMGECFGETWLREADKGAIAFWGASASSLWDEDDILDGALLLI